MTRREYRIAKMVDEGVWPYDVWLWTYAPEKHGCDVAQNGLDYREEVEAAGVILSARFTPEPEPEVKSETEPMPEAKLKPSKWPRRKKD